MPVSYKRRRSYGGYAPKSKRPRVGFLANMGQAVKTIAPYAINYLTSGSRTSSGQGVTSQYDRKVVYRRKRMPRLKRVRWVRFVKKVRSALLKEVGTKTVLRNSQQTYTDLTNNQGILTVTLYGKDGADSSGAVGNQDLKDIFGNDSDLALATDRAKFASAILDITITNNSTVTDSSQQNTGVEIDIYEITWTKKIDATRPTNVYYAAAANTNAINTLGTSLSITDRGATPFEFPEASALGAKIYKKTKIMLGQGEAATYQMRIAKNYNFRRDFIDDNDDNFVIPWVTKTLLFLIKGLPTGDATKVLKSVQLGATRKYSYKVIKGSSDQDQLLP